MSAVKAEAREKAIEDAKAKANVLAADLGVKIVRMTSYYENEGYYGAPMYSAKAEMGGPEMDSSFGGAQMPMGENETKVQVNISYEVK